MCCMGVPNSSLRTERLNAVDAEKEMQTHFLEESMLRECTKAPQNVKPGETNE